MNGRTAFMISRFAAIGCAIMTGISAIVSGAASQYMTDKAVEKHIKEKENKTEE